VQAAKMFTARKKIAKEKGAEPGEFEESVAQVWPWRPLASVKFSWLSAEIFGSRTQSFAVAPARQLKIIRPDKQAVCRGCFLLDGDETFAAQWF
jgi:hypothetical protein